jgi:hypothetical protein
MLHFALQNKESFNLPFASFEIQLSPTIVIVPSCLELVSANQQGNCNPARSEVTPSEYCCGWSFSSRSDCFVDQFDRIFLRIIEIQSCNSFISSKVLTHFIINQGKQQSKQTTNYGKEFHMPPLYEGLLHVVSDFGVQNLFMNKFFYLSSFHLCFILSATDVTIMFVIMMFTISMSMRMFLIRFWLLQIPFYMSA